MIRLVRAVLGDADVVGLLLGEPGQPGADLAEVEGGHLRDVAYVGSSYGLTGRSLGSVALLGPQRMDYEKAIRSVRAAAFELSRLVEEVYEGA